MVLTLNSLLRVKLLTLNAGMMDFSIKTGTNRPLISMGTAFVHIVHESDSGGAWFDW